MSRKLNTGIVKKEVEKLGFILIGEYIPKEKIKIKCPNNHIEEIWVHRLKHKNGCKECKKIERKNEIKNEIESKGYTLLNEYDGCSSTLKMICPYGHYRECKIDSFRRYECEKCITIKKLLNLIEQIENEGYLIVSVPLSTHGNVEAYCENGHYRNAKIFNFINHGCQQCNEHRNYNYTFDEVKEVFSQRGFTLLSDTYDNCKQKLKYICVCGRINDVTFDSMINSNQHLCFECKGDYVSENFRGENHWNWKGGYKQIKFYLRECLKEWKKNTMQACGYKCILTDKSFEDIHHLHSFNQIFDEIVNEIDFKLKEYMNEYTDDELKILNDKTKEKHYKYGLGICLTREVHYLFHDIYGRGNNTIEQFLEFVDNFYPNKLNEVELYINKYCNSLP